MNFSKLICLVIICGTAGYFAEPFIFPINTPSVEKTKNKNLSHESKKREVTLKPKDKAIPPPKVPSVSETITAPKIVSRAKVITTPNDTPIPHLKEISKPLQNEKPADPVIKIIKKPDFPIKNLLLGKYDKHSATGSEKLDKAVKYAIENDDFEDFTKLLEEALYKPFKKRKTIDAKNLKKLVKNPAWHHALNIHAMLSLFPPDSLGKITSVSKRSKDFYRWILTSPDALSEFLYNLTEFDNLQKAMLIWQDIWSNETDLKLRKKYLNLAIACALVYDKGTITPKTSYEPIDPLERYTIFRKNAEAHRLKTMLSKLPVSDLIWVIDVPLTASEIEWALRHAHFRRRHWGKAYGHIEYLMERAVEGTNPYSKYTLKEIEKHGGICGDQMYFSVNTAKANGIPAAGITGSGDRGGHAWFAYKPSKDKWNTSTGRYENYSNGTSQNSQTNQRISEFDFMLMSDRKMKARRVHEAKLLLRLAHFLTSMKHDRAGIKQVLKESIKTVPLLKDAWIQYVAFLEEETPELLQNKWQSVIDDMERVFKKYPSMWMTSRKLTQKHIWKYMKQSDIEKTQTRYRREISRKFPSRGDLIRKVIQEQGEFILKLDDFAKVRSFYRKGMRRYGKDTLNFKAIASAYFKAGSKFPDERKRICDDIEFCFSRYIDQESGDYFKAKTEIEILRTISNYYAAADESRKAEKLKKEAALRLKKSSRNAL